MQPKNAKKDQRGVARPGTGLLAGWAGGQQGIFGFYKAPKKPVAVSRLFFPEAGSDIQEVNR